MRSPGRGRKHAGEIGPEGLQRWRSDPRASWWEDARHTLAASRPVAVTTLTEALFTATGAAGEPPPERLLQEAAALPRSCATSPNSRMVAPPPPKRPASSFLAAALSHPTLIARLTPSAELLRLCPPPARVARPLHGSPPRQTSRRQRRTATPTRKTPLANHPTWKRRTLHPRPLSQPQRRRLLLSLRRATMPSWPPPRRGRAKHLTLAGAQAEVAVDVAAGANLRHAPTTCQRPTQTRPRPSAGTPLLQLKLKAWPPLTTSTSKPPAFSASSRCSPPPRASEGRCAPRCAQDYFHPDAPEDAARGWKLFCMSRPPNAAVSDTRGVPHPAGGARPTAESFRAGHWVDLLRQSADAAAADTGPRRTEPSDAQRARRAAALVRIGELSAAGTPSPPSHSPPAPVTRSRSCAIRRGAPPHRTPPYLSTSSNTPPLRRARSPCRTSSTACAAPAVAAGPSGMTNEHIRILLDDEEDAALLHGAAVRLANADVPPDVLQGIRSVTKPNGRVRALCALVVGDVLRRLVGRVLAQHFAPHLQQACMPHQFGLSTRAGTEAVCRLLRAATEACPRATVLSVDAVGAFDHVSRAAMLGALHARPQLQPLLPFARQFYAAPSAYTWYDDCHHAHDIF